MCTLLSVKYAGGGALLRRLTEPSGLDAVATSRGGMEQGGGDRLRREGTCVYLLVIHVAVS